jgi:hypothetical protein
MDIGDLNFTSDYTTSGDYWANAYYPAPASGSSASSGTDIFQSLSNSILGVAKSAAALETGLYTAQSNAAIAKTQAQTAQTVASLQAQSAIAKAQAAITGGGLLPLILIAAVVIVLIKK